MQTISWLSFFGVLFLLFLLGIVVVIHNKNFLNEKKNNFRWLYFALLVLFACWAIPTINNYLYPKKEKIFSNSDYHILEHKGFVFDSLLYLVRSNYPADNFPDEALWDNKTGAVILTHDSITIQNYFEPFFVEENEDGGRYFKLHNKIINDDVSQGFSLTKGDKIIYALQIVPFREDRKDKCYYISYSENSPADTSAFTQPINKGYPLSDIISRNPKFNFTKELQQLFDGALLVRENIPINNGFGRESTKENKSALILMPNSYFFYENDLKINGKAVSEFNSATRFDVSISGEKLFYSGIGRTKTDIFRIKPQEKNSVSLRYVLPKMQKLRKKDGRLFITSSVDEAVGSKIDGGYLYNIFDSEKNFNHINARIRYFVGSARDSMYFETMDLYADNPTVKNIIPADTEFLLQTKGKVNHDVQWIFNVKNLRETNSLQWDYFCLFIVIFVLLVGLRLLVDSVANSKSLSILELSVYVVVFCFSIVRLILGWRMSTFVPLEDLDATVFAKLRDGKSVWQTTCIALVLPVLFQTVSFFKKTPRFLDKLEEKISKIPIKYIFVSFLFILGICYLGSKVDSLNRLLNIPIPVIAYLLFNLWLLNKQDDDGVVFKRILPQVILWAITFVYLFFQDAGFSIIFLLYSLIHFFIIAKLIDKNSKKFKLTEFYRYKPLVIIFLCAIFFLFLKFQGDLLIFIFNNIKWILCAVSVVLCYFFVQWIIYFWKKSKFNKLWKYLVTIIPVVCIVGLTILNISEITKSTNFASNAVNSKNYMKFRAEVQKLKANEAIDDLMLNSNFDSKEITYIMRSAHNQWFINQYAHSPRADAKYFNLQPHFNQGSSFTTQTTDLVVTRYVLAEHGVMVLFWLMFMLLLLLLIYCYETRLTNENKFTSNFTMLGVFILLFAIALFVFLSATNRIVFFGQDFPFLSITSRIAVLFPLGLFSVAVWKMIIDRDGKGELNRIIQGRKIWIPIVLVALTASCVWFISPQGKDQKESQFDVSKIIGNIAEKVEIIDREFVKFQYIKETYSWSQDSVWNTYTDSINAKFAIEWNKAISDTTENNKFFSSLLLHFNKNKTTKNNPDELLHLRKRNNIYRLSVNKKHYFITSVMQKDVQWTGKILAAKTDRYFGFSEIASNKSKEKLKTNADYELDILPTLIHKQVPNIQIMRLDTSWVADKEPLLLITSKQSKGSKQFYHIETDSLPIRGSSAENQLATRIMQNDLVLLNIIDEKSEEKNIHGWKYGQDDEHFLAKNLWLNGKKQLFYPLGKESMWSYNFANHVSDVYGNNTEYNNFTIRVSIDYDLHKKFYEIINSENKNKLNLKDTTINQLLAFKKLEYEKRISNDERMKFRYDLNRKQIVCKEGLDPDLMRGIDRINYRLTQLLKTKEPEIAIDEAIDEVAEKRFDYSAVVIDGNGRIRALFDYSKNRKIDPNNIKYLNRFLSNLYKESDNASERDIFGNNALQLLVPGPGSSFKPIAYTAVTSQQQFSWETLELTRDYQSSAMHQNEKNEIGIKFDYYGGVFSKDEGESAFSLDPEGWGGNNHNNYLISSNNLYHSLIIMFGMQRKEQLKTIMKNAGNDVFAFPVFTHEGQRYSFNKDIWYNEGKMITGSGIMNIGLYDNFHLNQNMANKNNLYSNYFGEEKYLSDLFNYKESNYRHWTYAETGSQNTANRNLQPFIRNGLIQMSLGSYPLDVSPLQMAIMAMRLATLNSAQNITTLSDNATQVPNYDFFKTPTWTDSTAYFNFYKRLVLGQLRQVSKTGTANGLKELTRKYENKGYYIYTKTGTLNKDNEGKNARLKHLLVIISNTPLEDVATIADLKNVKYYVLYLSYIGIDKDEFGSTSRFGKIISATIESELFQKYMNSK